MAVTDDQKIAAQKIWDYLMSAGWDTVTVTSDHTNLYVTYSGGRRRYKVAPDRIYRQKKIAQGIWKLVAIGKRTPGQLANLT